MELNVKLNKSYKEAKHCKARYRVLYGGAGSGKSHYMAQEIIFKMLESGNNHYLVVRKVGKTLRNSVFRLVVGLINEYGLSAYFSVNKTEMMINCKTGSTLISTGLDDPEKIKSIAGINQIWIEEASELDEQDFSQLDLRLRGKSNVPFQMTLTFNPISEHHWLKRVFFDVGMQDSYICKTTYKDNAHLDSRYEATLESLKERDPQYYKIYCLGEWGSIGNLIYSNWEKADLSEEIKQFDTIYNGLDFGFSTDPTAFIRLHYDKTRKVIYIFDEIYQTDLMTGTLAEMLKERAKKEIITCDSSEPRTIAELKQLGVNAHAAKKGPGSVASGIKWLQQHKIIVHKSCVNTIRELGAYKYREDKNGNVLPEPLGINDHLMDSLRYATESLQVTNNWGWSK